MQEQINKSVNLSEYRKRKLPQKKIKLLNIARIANTKFDENEIEENDIGLLNIKCPNCEALHFDLEKDSEIKI